MLDFLAGARRAGIALGGMLLLALPSLVPAHAAGTAPVKIAFLADQSLGEDAEAVLQLVLDEGADAVVHSGDFDYADDPAAWDDQIDRILGPDFPYFASVGNHDDALVSGTDESGAYQQVMKARLERIGIPWEGVLGVRASLSFRGIFIVLTAPGLFGDGDEDFAPYIRERLAADDSIWSISSWHLNMRAMQVGGKSDATGWGVYDESRAGGAIIATGHEHSYSRTHLLARCELQEVASTEEPLVLSADDPLTPEDEGRSFVFVSGLGGSSVRDQELDGPWWASIYTADQNATHGALFAEFGFEGDPRLARFYFKDVAGNVPDAFFVESAVGREPEPLAKPTLACLDAQAKSFARVAKTRSGQLAACLKARAKDTLPGTFEACLAEDPKGKLEKAMQRTASDQARRCNDPLPTFGSADAAGVNAAASGAGPAILARLLGPSPAAPVDSSCEAAVAKAVDRCHHARIAAHQGCRRAGLRDGTIRSAAELAACLPDASDPKVAKTCEGGVAGAIAKRCAGVDLGAAFPACSAPDSASLAVCTRDAAASETCLALAAADALPDPSGACALDP